MKKKFNKGELECYACGKPGHFSKDFPERVDRRGKTSSKTVNMVTASNTDGYDNLPIVLSVLQSSSLWIDSGLNVHVCVDVSFLTSYQVAWDSSILMGNVSHASIYGIVMVDLKITLGKIMCATCPYYEQECS